MLRNYRLSHCTVVFATTELRARRCGYEQIFVMQAAQDRFREYERTRRQSMAVFGLRDYHNSSWRIRYARAQPAVWSTLVVMFDPQFQNRSQMCLGRWNHPVEAFSSYCPDHPLTYRVRLRTRHWGSQHFQTQRPDRPIKMLGEDLISVVD